MPITEIPPSPPTNSTPPPLGPFRGRRSRYEELEPEELFHVIDDLEGSKNRARIREFIWVSIIVHMIVFWYLAYGPRYFQHVRVVDPSNILKQREKELTYLDLPETLKKVKPKDSKVISDQDRKAETKKKLTIDKKTMEELQAMRKASPPAPEPAQPQVEPPAPQIAQQPQPQPKPAQPLQNNPLSQLEAPKPAPLPTNPSFNPGPATAGEAIRQAARDAAKNSRGFDGDTGANAPGAHPPSSAGGAEILSDTMGVDFGPYMRRVIYDTERAWWPIIPEVARPPLNKQGKVMIRFKIFPDGSVKNMILEGPSGDVSLDRAAWGGITGASPYPQLPKDFKGPYLELRFYFLYNIKPGDE
jgi:TonB family protein